MGDLLMKNIFLAALLFATHAFAANSVEVQGQKDSGHAPAVLIQAPLNQMTKVGDKNYRIETGSTNLLADPGFELSTTIGTNWLVGTLTSSSSTTSSPGEGLRAALLTPTSTPAILMASNGKTVPLDWLGKTAFATCQVSGAMAIGRLTLSVTIDGVTTTIAANQSTGPGFQTIGSTIPIPATATTINVNINQTNTDTTAFRLDDCRLELMPVFNLGLSLAVGYWKSAGVNLITSTGSAPSKGTTSIDRFMWRQNGQNMDFRIEYAQSATTGSVKGTGDILYGIPASVGCAIDSSLVTFYTGSPATTTNNTVGSAQVTSSTSSQPGSSVAYDATHFRIVAGANGSGSTNYVGGGNTWYDTTQASIAYVITGSVPCLGWQSLSALMPQQQASSWSGYFDSTCSWARTNAAYGDPTADATCALMQRTNNNFGTVTAVAGLLPGVTFTPVVTGQYSVCAVSKASPNITALAATLGIQLTDGSGTQLTESVETGLVTSGYQEFTTCATPTLTANTSTTVKLQTKASAGQITIGGNGGSAVEWVIFPISQSFPMGLITGNVSSLSSGTDIIARARFGGATTTTVCTASPCTLYSNNGGISSVTRSTTGKFTVNFPLGEYSGLPQCFFTIANGTTVNIAIETTSTPPTTTTFDFNPSSTGNTAQDVYGSIMCVGPK